MPLAKALRSLLTKLTAPKEESHGVAAGAVERALVTSAKGKVVPIQTSDHVFWIRLTAACARVGATIEDAAIIGEWMSHWGSNFKMTIDQVVNKWPSYLAKAKASQPEAPANERREFEGE